MTTRTLNDHWKKKNEPSDESNAVKIAEKAKPAVKPCSYGERCYRKNEQHLRDCHPEKLTALEKTGDKKTAVQKVSSEDSENTEVAAQDQHPAKRAKITPAPNDDDESKSNDPSHSESPTTSKAPSHTKKSENPESAFIKEKFLFDMPDDFYAFWQFARKYPENHLTDNGIELVGPFDVLNGKFTDTIKDQLDDSDYLRHWRFWQDPPEAQTVINLPDNDEHLAYWRDDASDHPVVCSIKNSATHFAKINIVGDNLFAALVHLSSDIVRSHPKLGKWFAELTKFAEKQNLTLNPKRQVVRDRQKKVVARCLHGAGIVVPVINDVGYRELSETDAALKKMLKIIGETDEEPVREGRMEKLQEIITYVQFANDEADFGMGLELGHDLFNAGYKVLHNQTAQLLSVAYMLLGRGEFSQIMDSHLRHRKEGSELSILDEKKEAED